MGFAEAQVAGRYTQYGEMGSSSILKLRSMAAEDLVVCRILLHCFCCADLRELYVPRYVFAATNDKVFNDTSGTFRTNTSRGNPDLKPETATVMNFGFSLSLLDDAMTVGLDWANYQFEDRVTLMRGPTVVDLDFANFQAKYPNATDADRVTWVTSEQDMNIKRLGVDPYTILEIIGTYVNAQEMDTTSIDLYATMTSIWGKCSLRLGLTLLKSKSSVIRWSTEYPGWRG